MVPLGWAVWPVGVMSIEFDATLYLEKELAFCSVLFSLILG